MALSFVLKGPAFRSLASCVVQGVSARPALSFLGGSLSSVVSRLGFSTTNALENVRCHFPRPCEIKRIRRHGWKKRMSTLAGRKIIMNRILKGRWVLSH